MNLPFLLLPWEFHGVGEWGWWEGRWSTLCSEFWLCHLLDVITSLSMCPRL